MPSTSLNHSERAHAIYGASSCERWLCCPGSIALLEEYPTAESTFASEGTMAHECCEEYFANDGMLLNSEYDREMTDYAKTYSEILMKLGKGNRHNVYVEQRVKINEEMYGTVDAVILTSDSLDIVDFKYGKGIDVEVEDNSQLMFYAVAVMETEQLWNEIKKVGIHIYQPRTGDGQLKSWEASTQALWNFKVLLEEQAAMIKKGLNQRTPGEHCTFCQKAVCPEYKTYAMGDVESFPAILEGGSVPDTKLLSLDDLGKLVIHGKKMKKMIDDAEKLARNLLENGEKIEGLKVVAKRASRKQHEGISPLSLARRIGVKQEVLCKDPQPRSYTDISKLIKAEVAGKDAKSKKKRDNLLEDLDAMYYHESSGTVVVPESDKRVSCVITDGFDNLDESDNTLGDMFN